MQKHNIFRCWSQGLHNCVDAKTFLKKYTEQWYSFSIADFCILSSLTVKIMYILSPSLIIIKMTVMLFLHGLMDYFFLKRSRLSNNNIFIIDLPHAWRTVFTIFLVFTLSIIVLKSKIMVMEVKAPSVLYFLHLWCQRCKKKKLN